MRILYISDNLPRNFTFIFQDIKNISEIHDVMYMTFEDENYSLINNDHLNFKLNKIKYPSQSFKSKIRWRLEKLGIYFKWSDKSFSKKLKIEIEKFNPDIIHCQFAYESSKLFHNMNVKIPVIVNFRGYGASHKLKNRFYVKWLGDLLRKKNVFPVYVSNSLKINLENKNIIPRNVGIILYTGIDTKKFKRKTFDNKKEIKFIQVGSFNEKKGQYYTIKAFSKLNLDNPNLKIKLQFIGSGKNLDKCKKLTKKLNLENKIIFHGKLDHNGIINLLEQSNIFVHHSITAKNGDQEGIPNAVIEAMAMQMPILSTYHSGIPEAVEHNLNGLLCKEKDINTLASQMKQIINWDYKIDNRQKVIEKFCLSKHLRKLNNFYLDINKKSTYQY